MAGIKLYINGVMIVGFSEIRDIDGKIKSIDEMSNLKEGDRILEVNNKKISSIEELKEAINLSNNEEIEILVEDSNKNEKKTKITPIKTDENEYKIGLLVKEGATGVGTISFYNPKTNEFAALGHGIVDIDTGKLLNIKDGELTKTEIVSLSKGLPGSPGEVRGIIKDEEVIGKIKRNTEFGIYGDIENNSFLNIDNKSLVDIGLRSEIKEGKAEILCSLDGKKSQKYEIEIQKIFYNNNQDNKSFVLKVTDKNLIEKTGGIIRGLSGSPIIQNGKLIGVVTNVLVSSPLVGYGVFADLML